MDGWGNTHAAQGSPCNRRSRALPAGIAVGCNAAAAVLTLAFAGVGSGPGDLSLLVTGPEGVLPAPSGAEAGAQGPPTTTTSIPTATSSSPQAAGRPVIRAVGPAPGSTKSPGTPAQNGKALPPAAAASWAGEISPAAATPDGTAPAVAAAMAAAAVAAVTGTTAVLPATSTTPASVAAPPVPTTTTTVVPLPARPAAPTASSLGTVGIGGDGGWSPTPADPGYTFLYPGAGGRPAAWWSPCTPIRYAVNLSDAPTGALDDATAAVAYAARASGLRFEYVGTTSLAPDPAGPVGQLPSGIDAVIGWVTPAALGGPPKEAGAGGSWWEPDGAGERITQGYALLNGDIAKSLLRPGFDTGYSEGHLLLHELGHMLGLGHTSDPAEVMYPQQGPLSPSAYGAGDLQGLRSLGSQPCI